VGRGPKLIAILRKLCATQLRVFPRSRVALIRLWPWIKLQNIHEGRRDPGREFAEPPRPLQVNSPATHR